jgi:hypothetical protein
MDKIVLEYLDEAIYGLYDDVAEGKMTTQEALEEFLSFPLKGLETVTPSDKQVLYRRMKSLFRKIEKEKEDWDLYENKKVRISESKLKSIIRESIEEIMTGDYINQGIDKQWADPNSPLRQFGDEWLKMTMDLCNKYNSTINPQELISLMKPIVVKIMMKKQ